MIVDCGTIQSAIIILQRLLLALLPQWDRRRGAANLLATWPSGKARVCKTLITGSNPVVASIFASTPSTPLGVHFYILASEPIDAIIVPVSCMSPQPMPAHLVCSLELIQ